MTRREGTSKSNSFCATGQFASKMNRTQIYDSLQKIIIARDPAVRFGSRQVTRREGTSKSNSLCATGQFGKKMNRAQICDSHRKIDIARDPSIRFGSRQVKPVQLFMAEPPVTARSHEKFVLDKLRWHQSPAWRSNFSNGPENLCFDQNRTVERM